MIYVATIVCAVACLVLVGAEYKQAAMLRIVSKCVASAAFIAVGYLAAHEDRSYERHILLGLVLGAVGDVALLGRSNRAFMAGLVAFLLGHLAYVIACIHTVDPHETLGLAGLYAVAPAIVGLGALAYLWPRLGKMRVPVILYVAVIISMVVAAIAVGRSETLPLHARERLVIGAVLFFISDLAVARDKFVAKGFSNRAWGLPTYYAGQLFIAWSLASS
ncbi:MAG TPA: lysoplasmalogenase [Kofleriaceae bacterium]|nr:lysoplasmalogenase [Kofleriaceae bacterium]